MNNKLHKILICIIMLLSETILLTSCDNPVLPGELPDSPIVIPIEERYVSVEILDPIETYDDYCGLYFKKIVKITSLEQYDSLKYNLDLKFVYTDKTEDAQNPDLLDHMLVSSVYQNICISNGYATDYNQADKYIISDVIEAGETKYYEIILDLRNYDCEYLKGDIGINVGCDLYNADAEQRHIKYITQIAFFLLKLVLTL